MTENGLKWLTKVQEGHQVCLTKWSLVFVVSKQTTNICIQQKTIIQDNRWFYYALERSSNMFNSTQAQHVWLSEGWTLDSLEIFTRVKASISLRGVFKTKENVKSGHLKAVQQILVQNCMKIDIDILLKIQQQKTQLSLCS